MGYAIIISMSRLTTYIHKNATAIASMVLIVVVLSVGGYFVGYRRGSFQSVQTLTTDGATAKADYSVYWQAWKILKDNFVDADTKTDQDLMYGSITGLAQSYGDPHTVFFPPEEGKSFTEQVNGSFGGIGAEIGEKDGIIQVVAPLKGSPAEKAGIEAGDWVLKINATSTEGLDVNHAVMMIRGEIGTTVTLNVFRREKWLQPKDIQIVRQRIELPTLDTTYFDKGKIAQLQLYAFNQNAPLKFYEAATQLLLKGTKGIILDMRNNPGGYLEVSRELAGWFVDRGTLIVSEHFKTGADETFLATGNGALKNIPIVILLNRGSASASEILAGALRDIRGAKIIGENSYGKGTVQELMDLKDGSSLKVTIAHWVMPKGQILDHTGIKPDYEVLPTDEEIKAKKDVQLDKALEVLRAQLNGSPLPAVAQTDK
jgi:carboxyl-terminal processing protease